MASFNGWIRLPGKRWQAVVSGDSEDDAWRLLRQHVDRLKVQMIDTFVGPAEVDPRGRRRPEVPQNATKEDPFVYVFKAAGLPLPVPELRFAPPRRWRFDYAWPDEKIALEIEGGVWSGGRHVRGRGYEKDCEKYNAAALLGWRVLRVTTGMVSDGRAMEVVQRAFAGNAGIPQGSHGIAQKTRSDEQTAPPSSQTVAPCSRIGSPRFCWPAPALAKTNCSPVRHNGKSNG